jgi:hypothetical protein
MNFKRNKIDIRMINPSSKISLKMSCLASCKGDIEQASKLYNFLIEGIENIPDMDMPQQTAFEQIKQGTNQVLSWIKENKNELAQGYNFIQSIRNGTPMETQVAPVTEIPPLPNETD